MKSPLSHLVDVRENEDKKLLQTFTLLFQIITSLPWQKQKHILLYQVAFAIHVPVIFWEVKCLQRSAASYPQ